MKCACSRILIFLLKKGVCIRSGEQWFWKNFYVEHRMREYQPGQREDTH